MSIGGWCLHRWTEWEGIWYVVEARQGATEGITWVRSCKKCYEIQELQINEEKV